MATAQEVQQLYIAYLGRAADQAGLDYWVSGDGAVLGLDQLRANFVFEQPEYLDVYEGLSREEMLNTIYANLFERAPDADGLEYWLNGDGSAVTANDLLLAFLNGASTADQVVVDNKVTVAQAYTAAAGVNFTPATAAAAIANVDGTQASVDAALAQIESDFPAGPLTLAEQIEALAAANAAKTAFLTDEDGNPIAEGSFATAASNALTALDALITGDYATASAGVQAALLADQQEANDAALTTAQATLADAEADVAAVSGLATAIAELDAATAAADAAAAAAAPGSAIVADLAAAEAQYESLNAVTVTVNGDGTVVDTTHTVDLIVLVDGELVLATGITEEGNPGVTELLTATQAKEAADAALVAANAAEAAAQAVVDRLDLTTAAQTELAEVGAAFEFVTPADVNAPTDAEIDAEAAELAARILTLETDINNLALGADEAGTEASHAALTAAAVTAGYISADDKAAIDAAFNAQVTVTNDATELANAKTASVAALDLNNGLVTLNALVADFELADNANPLTEALATAETGVETAQAAIDALADALADLAAAEADVATLAALNAAIDEAEATFTDAGMAVPSTLAAGGNTATADDDIFLAVTEEGTADSSITNFGVLGDDVLYIGTGFTFNADAEAGDNAVLEVFMEQVGSDTVVSLEESVFGSNAATPELIQITLTGVALADVTLQDGFISVA